MIAARPGFGGPPSQVPDVAGSRPVPPSDAQSRPTASGSRPRLVVGLSLLLIVAVGAAARIWAIDFGLPHTQARPDETQVMDVSLHHLRGNMWPPFYDYPRVYNYVLTLAYLAWYVVEWLSGRVASLADLVARWPTDWAPFFLINRALAAASGTMTILVVWAIGRRLGGAATGVVAALFMALAYGHVRESHFGTTDTTLVLLGAASVLWLLRSDLRRLDAAGVVAALLAGLAAGTKYNGVVLLVPLGISQLVHAADRLKPRAPGGPSPEPLRAEQSRPRVSLTAYLAELLDRRAWVSALAFGATFAVGVPFVFFDFPQYWRAMQEMASILQTGLAPRAGPVNGWSYHLATSLNYGLGRPMLVAGLVGVVLATRRDWRAGLLTFSFPIAYIVVAGSLGALFVRYALPVVPFLCVGAAVTVVWLAALVSRDRWWGVVVVAALSACLVAPSVARIVAFVRVMAQTDNRVLAAEWIDRHASEGATVMVSGSPYGYPQFGPRIVFWRWDRRLQAFVHRGQRVDARPDWILLQESPLPSSTQAEVTRLLGSGYELMIVLRAYDPAERDNVYDPQDAFFVPFAAFRKVRRPGPNFAIYRRLDTRYVAEPVSGLQP